MRDFFLLQVSVHPLADAEESVLVAARKSEQFQFPGRVGIWDKVRGLVGVRCRGESTDPGKSIEVRQSEIQRLAPAHRKPGQRAILAI